MPTELLTKGLAAPKSATPRRTVKLAPEGIVTAIVAVTGVEDAVDDLIVPGAFSHTLTVRRPKVVDDHEWKNKVGRVLHIEEWAPGDRRLPKRTKDGKPWPAAAGALVATMQYNLRAERGREAYEWVRFYAESNEAEFSIGYKVVPGKGHRRRDGVRVILMVDLYELSHVLFGAAPLSMALEVKGLHGGSAGAHRGPALGTSDEVDDFTDPPKTDPRKPWDDDEDDDKAPLEAKTAASVLLEAKSQGGMDRNRGNAEDLRQWFVHGAGATQIGWGSGGDFTRCVTLASKHMTVEQAKGYCNLRHKDALGFYPAEHAAMEGKNATHPKEIKAMSRMKGSYEERIALLDTAARDLLATTLNRDDVSAWPVATYATEAVFTVCGPDGEESYLIPYEADESGAVSLGEPEKVELSLVAEPENENEAASDDALEDAVAETPEQMVVSAMLAPVARLAVVEGKSGDYLRAQLRELMESKGYAPPVGDDVDDDVDDDLAAELEGAPGDDLDDEAMDAEGVSDEDADDLGAGPSDGDADDDAGDERVTLDPAEHFALMDDLDRAGAGADDDEDAM